MRKLLLSILLASAVATPALADPDNPHDRQQHADRQDSRGDRHENRGNAERAPAPVQNRFNGANNRQPPPQVVQQQGEQHHNGNWAGRFTGGPQGNPPQSNEDYRNRNNGFANGQGQPGQHYDRNRNNGYANGQGQQYDRNRNNRYANGQYNDRNNWNHDRSRWANGGWNRNWRSDHRYDWHSYREHHRSVFHLGVYFDPFGYGYRPFGIGYQLAPAYFGQRYWIDPGLYQLPYPPPGTQWVRYWNDALLVDMYSGEVVDVIHNFFW
jgi:Ni/Co efflux regulator RcnB